MTFFGERFFFKKRYRICLIIISTRFSFIVKEKSGSKRVQRNIAEKCVRATFRRAMKFCHIRRKLNNHYEKIFVDTKRTST